MTGIVILVLVILVLLSKAIYVLREYERGVMFRLGRLIGVRGPGFILIIPFVDRLVRVVRKRRRGGYCHVRVPFRDGP